MSLHYRIPEAPMPLNIAPAWETFLQGDTLLRPPGLGTYREVFDHPTIFPLQRAREMQRMLEAASVYWPTTVFEIGADKGGGLYHWCKLPSVRQVIACEMRGTPYAESFEKAFPHIDFLWLPQSSFDSQTVAQVAEWLDTTKIDVLFIDGDKSKFKNDFDAYKPLMATPGIVFVHDINNDKVPLSGYKAILAGGYRHSEIIDISEYQDLAGSRKPETPHEHWLMYWHGRSCGVGVIYLE